MPALNQLPAYDPESGELNVVIETTRGASTKYKYDPELRLFRHHYVLPPGAVFPFDFGFVPSTRGQDGDPLDVLVLMDEPSFPGCLVRVRLVGVIQAEQTNEGETVRNDRLIAVPGNSHLYRTVRSLDELSPELLDNVEHFFVSYNQTRGRQFKPVGRGGPRKAEKLVQAGQQSLKGASKRKKKRDKSE